MRPAAPLARSLMALLDALEQDLLAAPAAEVQDAQRHTGRARRAACHEVRSLLIEALAASEDGAAATASPRIDGRNSMQRHLN